MIRWNIQLEIGAADDRLFDLFIILTELHQYVADHEIGCTWVEERDPGEAVVS